MKIETKLVHKWLRNPQISKPGELNVQNWRYADLVTYGDYKCSYSSKKLLKSTKEAYFNSHDGKKSFSIPICSYCLMLLSKEMFIKLHFFLTLHRPFKEMCKMLHVYRVKVIIYQVDPLPTTLAAQIQHWFKTYKWLRKQTMIQVLQPPHPHVKSRSGSWYIALPQSSPNPRPLGDFGSIWNTFLSLPCYNSALKVNLFFFNTKC